MEKTKTVIIYAIRQVLYTGIRVSSELKDRNFYLAFSVTPGIGPIKFAKLLKSFGSAENAWKATSLELKDLLGEKLTTKFEDFRKEFDVKNYLEQLEKQKISFVCLNDDNYPRLLKQIPNPPIILYAKGNIKILRFAQNDNRIIAIVGTRHITHYGREITEMFASELAKAGLVIVSGMAYGVDGVAHASCLSAGGKTIAVLGNGVDLPYPRENQKLYEEILDSGNLIISEYAPGTPPSPGSFPARNRIVAGMSDAVLVTEGAQDSGSLITANFGLEFDRKVFAVPGPITSSLSAAPLKLIEKGAKLVVTPGDVIKELGIKASELKKNEKKFEGLSKDEKKIIELIENESLNFDEIVHRLKFDPSKVGSTLSIMEMKGLIKNSGGSYSVTV